MYKCELSCLRQGQLTYSQVSGSPEPAANVQLVAVDYMDVESLSSILEEYNTETVISAVNNITGDNEPELNLIRAAERSKATKRFIPSYFGVPYLPEYGPSTFPPSLLSRCHI